jgi:RNA polymerase sigma-70 factor (ECF subfamily)
MDEDRETIQKVLSGDFDAFEQLVQKYEARVYRHIWKMVKDNQLSQDLLQETFLSAYKGLEQFTGASSFSTWLFRIATNTALMFLRKHRPENVEYSDEIGGLIDRPYAVPSEFLNTPLDALLSKEGRAKISQAIEELPVLYRSVIVLRDVEGFSLEEVSKIMESSVAAVKSRLHRARNYVRESLSVYYKEKSYGAKKKSAQ